MLKKSTIEKVVSEDMAAIWSILTMDEKHQITDNFGLFAKVAYCSIMDKDLRDAADHSSGADYGKHKDFAWAGVGVTFNF